MSDGLRDDDADEVEAVVQHALYLLLEHLTLLVPVHHSGVVRILDLDGEGDTGGGQLFHGGITVLFGLGFVKEVGEVCKAAALSIIYAFAVGTEGRRSDGVQLVVIVAFRRVTASVTDGLMAYRKALRKLVELMALAQFVRLVLGIHAGHGPV